MTRILSEELRRYQIPIRVLFEQHLDVHRPSPVERGRICWGPTRAALRGDRRIRAGLERISESIPAFGTLSRQTTNSSALSRAMTVSDRPTVATTRRSRHVYRNPTNSAFESRTSHSFEQLESTNPCFSMVSIDRRTIRYFAPLKPGAHPPTCWLAFGERKGSRTSRRMFVPTQTTLEFSMVQTVDPTNRRLSGEPRVHPTIQRTSWEQEQNRTILNS